MGVASGALAQIDVLGIFGREGLDMATLWEPYADFISTPEAEFVDKPVFWGMRLYRNYDGLGSKFGSTALLTTSSDESVVSAFAGARDDGATTVVLLNKDVIEQQIAIDGIAGNAQVYRYLRSSPKEITALDQQLVSRDQPLALPARSATLLVLQP
jgi:hypothetical protein